MSAPGLEGTSLTGGELWSGGGRLAICPTPAPNGAQTLIVGAVAAPVRGPMDEEGGFSCYVIVIAVVRSRYERMNGKGAVTWYDHDYIIIYFSLSCQWIAIDDSTFIDVG